MEGLGGGRAWDLEGQGGGRGGRPDVDRGAAAAAAAAAAADDDDDGDAAAAAEVAFNVTRASDLIIAVPPAGSAGAGATIDDDDGDAIVNDVNDDATNPGSVQASANAAVTTVAAGAAADLIAEECS